MKSLLPDSLKGEISFLGIERVISSVMEKHHVISQPDLGTIIEADQWAREVALKM